jgi:hypothetical protein
LTRLYLAREDIPAARRYLETARRALAGSGRAALQAEADALAAAVAVQREEA